MDKPLKVAPGGIIRKVAWLPIIDRRVIFARSHGQMTAYNIGGKINKGESRIQALLREGKEEADVGLIETTVDFYKNFLGPCHGYVEGTKLHMDCFFADYDGILKPSSEIAELVALSSRDIGTGATTIMGDDILRDLVSDGYID